MWVPELFQQCENFFGISVLHFVGYLLGDFRVGLMATICKRTYTTSCGLLRELTLYMDITRWLIPKSDGLYFLQLKMEKLYTVRKNKTRG